MPVLSLSLYQSIDLIADYIFGSGRIFSCRHWPHLSSAGKTINEHNDDLNIDLGHDAELYLTVKRQIPQTWTDVNGHMNETNYLEVCSQATDKFMEMMGMDVDYIKTKQESYFSSLIVWTR